MSGVTVLVLDADVAEKSQVRKRGRSSHESEAIRRRLQTKLTWFCDVVPELDGPYLPFNHG